MESTWLVQALNPPVKYDNPFNFGGGYKNGGLSNSLMDKIRPLCEFEYMGAAEFEFGNVPKAFNLMVDHGKRNDLASWMMDEWDTNVYVIGSASNRAGIEDRIMLMGKDKLRLKSGISFASIVNPSKWDKARTYQPTQRGWLELNNGFMFFTSKDMFDGFCKLFEGK